LLKLALVTTPPGIRSGIGDYTRHLLPYLREHAEVELFVAPEHAGMEWEGETPRSALDLRPREHDQVLYQLGNEGGHAFMVPMIRSIGGTVMQHDWVLFDLALGTYPALVRGGWKGHLLAFREGGIEQARTYARTWMRRKHERTSPVPAVDAGGLAGTLLSGWHAMEDAGRWTADHAVLRVPAEGVRSVRVELATEGGRALRLRRPADGAEAALAEAGGDHVLELGLEGADEPVLVLSTEGIAVSEEQRKHGDARRLGSFVRSVTWTDGAGEHSLDVGVQPRVPLRPACLPDARFELPLNRSVVRFADAFLVHSEYVKQRILSDRNSATPVGVVHHGAERRWHGTERHQLRARLGLPAAWKDDFLVVSFGGVQPHKRIDQVLAAVARARAERSDVRLVLAGKWSSEEMDPPSLARALGIEDSVHFAGFVPEEQAWDLIHSGDVAINLRGPTSGGTSGGIFQSFALARAVIVTDAAEQSELPDACVVKVPLGESEVPALARTLVELRDDPARLRALEAGVRRFVDDECHWGVVAGRYAEHLGRFPRARAGKRALVSMRTRLEARLRASG
jgi:glycosyltransferase involved in cell wall biosynthesis